MKRIEFERLLATKGWRLDGENVRGSSGRILITASQSGVGNIDSYYDAFSKLPHEDKQLLLKWAVKYSLTPIEEREEVKKYKYKVPKFLWADDWDCLFRCKNDDSFLVGCDVFFDDYDFQAHFTDAEIEDLIEKYGENFKRFIEICEKVEVE